MYISAGFIVLEMKRFPLDAIFFFLKKETKTVELEGKVCRKVDQSVPFCFPKREVQIFFVLVWG